MLKVEQLNYHVGETTILSGLNFQLAKDQSLALLGKSGCGKTTTLNCIAGIITPSQGQIFLENKLLSTQGKSVTSIHQRQIGMIFQDYALFPHMTVYQKITFGLHNLNHHQKKALP